MTSIVQSPTINTQYTTYTAAGTFMIVGLTVSNIGNAPVSYVGINQKLIVGKRQYGYSGEPTFAINLNANSTINPGLGIDTVVAFDVPKGSQPNSIEVHEDVGSPGAYGALG